MRQNNFAVTAAIALSMAICAPIVRAEGLDYDTYKSKVEPVLLK